MSSIWRSYDAFLLDDTGSLPIQSPSQKGQPKNYPTDWTWPSYLVKVYKGAKLSADRKSYVVDAADNGKSGEALITISV